MQSFKYMTIAHADQDVPLPISEARLDRVIALLGLRPDAKILDLHARKGEVLTRVLERFGGEGLGLETCPTWLAAARAEAASRLSKNQATWTEAEGWEIEVEPESYDLVICLDSRPWGDYRETLRKAWALVRSGGVVLLGERYWRCKPAIELLEMMGCGPDTYLSYADTVELAVRESFTPMYLTTSSVDEFDHHEGISMGSIERFLRANPKDPHANAFRERVRLWRRCYLEHGRGAMGFALCLLLK